MPDPLITIETKVWEGDWDLVLNTSRISTLFERCSHPSAEKILYINNVSNLAKVEKAIQPLLANRKLDKYIHVEQYAKEALDFFELRKSDLTTGYYYSIAELVSIYLTKSEYLLHLSSDSIPSKNLPDNWVETCISAFSRNPAVKVCNLTWNYKYKEAKKEMLYDDELFYFGLGFSDQMYLIRTQDFQKPIYTDSHPASKRYPEYGGELFEKKVDSWMRNNNYLRATLKNGSYIHRNYTKNKWLKKLAIYLNQPNLFSR